VNANGSLVRDSNVTSVSKLVTGVYCVFLDAINAAQVGAVVTPHGASAQRRHASVFPGECAGPGGPGVQATIWSQTFAQSDSAFTIVVP